VKSRTFNGEKNDIRDIRLTFTGNKNVLHSVCDHIQLIKCTYSYSVYPLDIVYYYFSEGKEEEML